MSKEKKDEKKEGKKLSEKLTFSFKHIGGENPEHFKKADKFCEGYKIFWTMPRPSVNVSARH